MKLGRGYVERPKTPMVKSLKGKVI